MKPWENVPFCAASPVGATETRPETAPGYASQLERGTKQPKSPALALLNVIKRKGFEATSQVSASVGNLGFQMRDLERRGRVVRLALR